MHGSDGPLHVEDVRDKRPIQETFLDAMNEFGIPRNPDFNGSDQAGCGHYQFTQHNGRRWSTASAYLDEAKKRKNVTILTHAVTHRILFEGVKATGVEVFVKGKKQKINGRQVILSGGSIASPQLLELSGVGDADRLQKLGIEVVHNSPDVGEHLQDHLLSKVVFATAPEVSINREVQGWRLGLSSLNWFFRRQGPLTTGSAPIGAFWYTREGLEAPDVQVHFASGATLYNNEGKIQPTDMAAMTAVVNQSRPESRGSIHIATANAVDAPKIHANYLSTQLDRDTMVKGLRILIDVFSQPSLEPYLKGRLAPTPDINCDSDDELLEYIRGDASTVYHPTSTCSIGKVVDENLKVMGTENLHVVDASVMPYVVSGNTNAATIMVAEKAADQMLTAAG